jgi:DNA-binding SARP family transcriptional activator
VTIGVLTVLAGRWAVPLPDPAARGRLSVDGMSPSVPLVIDLLPGEVHIERLAADLTRAGRPPRWVRLAPYDLDWAALDALVAAMAGGTGDAEQADPRRPVVIESDDCQQSDRFLTRLVPAEPSVRTPCIVVLRYRQTGRKYWKAEHTRGITQPTALSEPALERLTSGRVALHDSILEAGRRLPPGELTDLIEQSRDVDDLTARIAARLLHNVSPRTVTLLGFAALLGYCHPRFGALESVLESCERLPLWTRLTGGWRRFEPAWRAGILAVCRSDRQSQVALLGRLIGELVEDGAADAAIELCLDAGCMGTASDLLAGVGPDLLAAGRPRSVWRWLGRLPWVVRRRHHALAVRTRAARRVAQEPIILPGNSARPSDTAPAGNRAELPDTVRPVPDPAQPVDVSPLALQAHLLGPVDIAIGGHRVEHWHGRKGTLLLAYLLLHRGNRAIPWDALAAAFWPDTPPNASRNRLHVALHGLRTDLQSASPVPVVLYDHGYTLNPELEIRLDTEEFERMAARGKQAEQDGDIEAALSAYRAAVQEYRGDLLSDHPYDGWTLLPRQHYRVRMLDLLGWAAQLAFGVGRYAESVETGQRLLALDFCREDLHRLLMRAYSRLGRPHLALHQFSICSRQLRHELDMAPARETMELYDRIRARSPV